MSESNMTGDNTELDTLKGEPQADAQLEDVKPVKDSDEKINLKIMTSEGAEVHFKIKRGLRLDRLAEAYAKKIGRDISSIRLLYDGTRIQDDDTPESLDMEDNDTIDVMVEQIGGSGA